MFATFKKIKLLPVLAVCFLFFPVAHVGAADNTSLRENVVGQLEAAKSRTEFSDEDPRTILAQRIKAIMTLVGTIFMVLIIMAGYWRFTARGEEEKITKSNKTIIGAVVGLAVALSAYAIADFVARRVQNAASEEPVYEIEERQPRNAPQDEWTFKLN